MLLEKNLEKKNNKYMVGFDLGDRDAQISFCSVQQKEIGRASCRERV